MKHKRICIKTVMVILMLGTILITTAAAESSNTSDFIIVNEVLCGYSGTDTTVTIPEGITEIKMYAFSPSSPDDPCCSITTVIIPEGVKVIGPLAFYGCWNLQKVSFPSTLSEIGDSAFSSCKNLNNITIPNGVKSIGNQAFYGCERLKDILISESVDHIGGEAFERTPWQMGRGDFVTINHNLTRYQGSSRSVTIPEDVTVICSEAFINCTEIRTVTIPNSVVELEAQSFFNCYNLTDVTIPSSVTKIGDDCFSYCKSKFGEGESEYVPIKNLTIHCIAGSCAEEYAQRNHIPFVAETISVNMPLWSEAIAYASAQSVLIDSKAVEIQCYALKDTNGNPTNYVKLRDVAHVLNRTKAQFQVGWDGAVNIIPGQRYTSNGSEMSTPFSGNRDYTPATAPTKVNGKEVSIDAIVLTDDKGGAYTYYKLRDLGEAIGFQVGWSAEKGIFIKLK